jgi:putative transposase
MYIMERKAWINIELACEVLNVKRSSYYSWIKRELNRQPQIKEERELEQKILSIFVKSKNTYGAPRVAEVLQKESKRIGINKIRRKMKELGLKPVGAKKYKATTDSRHKHPVFNNLLERNFNLQQPNKGWVCDITYLWTDEGWYYLAVVIDLFSRQVVGYKLSSRMTKDLVINALTNAVKSRNYPTGVIVHSDRGSQYASNEYKRILAHYGLLGSMSRKGDCWDNAVAESFFATMKKEYVYQTKFRTRIQAHLGTFDYIEAWYNNERIHTKLGGLSPKEFEANYAKMANFSRIEVQTNLVQLPGQL